MKFLIPSILFLFIASYGSAQIIWTEDFSAGSAARGTSAVGYPGSSGGNWTQTVLGAEGGSANQWYVSGEECGNATGNCGSACSNGDASLHISAIGGLCGTPDCGAAYDETSGANATNKRIESPTISTLGYSSLTLDFGYIAAQGDDVFTVEYSCNGGTTWNTLATPNATQCCSCLDPTFCAFFGICCAPQTQQSCAGGGQGYWTNYSFLLPICAENISNFRLGFTWANDGNGVGTDPSVAIDDISITAGNVLPVELASIQAENIDQGNKISWLTTSEKNNSHFVIEHSFNGVLFHEIGRVQGNGTTTESQKYEWMHKNPALGANYYRLKQVDFNSDFVYSQTVYAENELNELISLFVYPNPASEVVHIQYYSSEGGNCLIQITDLTGRVLLAKDLFLKAGVNSIEMSLTSIQKGNYRIVVHNEAKRTSKLLIIE